MARDSAARALEPETSSLDSTVESKLPEGWLSAAQVADIFGKSERTIIRHAYKYGGVRGHGKRGLTAKWLFDERKVLALKGDKPRSTSKPSAEMHEGERDARVFAALEEGKSVSSIVVAEKVPARIVLTLRETWLAAHSADRKGLTFPCSCGAPSDPHTAHCAKCAARARVLTEGQLSLLDGAELPEPNTCKCSGCSTTVDVLGADHVCTRCAAKLRVVVREGTLCIMVGTTVLRALPPDEMREITSQLAPSAPPAMMAPLPTPRIGGASMPSTPLPIPTSADAEGLDDGKGRRKDGLSAGAAHLMSVIDGGGAPQSAAMQTIAQMKAAHAEEAKAEQARIDEFARQTQERQHDGMFDLERAFTMTGSLDDEPKAGAA